MSEPADSRPDGSEPPPAYQPPPPPGYEPPPAPYGYAPPPGQYGNAPEPVSPQDERLWSTLCHASFFVLGFLGPLIALLVYGQRSTFIRHHAVEALNFHITVMIASVVAGISIVVLIGIVLLPAVLLGAAVSAIIGSVAANGGQWYRYPINLRLVR